MQSGNVRNPKRIITDQKRKNGRKPRQSYNFPSFFLGRLHEHGKFSVCAETSCHKVVSKVTADEKSGKGAKSRSCQAEKNPFPKTEQHAARKSKDEGRNEKNAGQGINHHEYRGTHRSK